MAAERFSDLVRELGTPNVPERWWFMQGVVAGAPAAGPPPTVQVNMAGGAVQPLRYPRGLTLADGDVVWVACVDTSAMFVAFVLA